MIVTPDEFTEAGNPAYSVEIPDRQVAPIVLNSPHSGRVYPEPFLASATLGHLAIRKSEDFLVDKLIASGPKLGLPLLAANFPRVYLDVNREPYEFDPQLFDGQVPAWANTSSTRVSGGLGTIARIVAEGEPIYRNRLPISEGLRRIEHIYKPYHNELRMLLARTHVNFGFGVLLDFHSMPSSYNGRGSVTRADFVIGDRHGTSAASGLTLFVRKFLENLGFRVTLNQPYAGGFITEHYGRPSKGLHAIQIEINRGLYMDEIRQHPTENFEELQNSLSRLLAALVENTGIWLEGSQPLAAE